MLPVVECLAPKALSALEEQRVATGGDADGVETQHGARLKPATGQLVAGHEHAPVQASELTVTSRVALLVVLAVDETVQHQFPIPGHEVFRRHRDGIGNPRRARTHAVHRDAEG